MWWLTRKQRRQKLLATPFPEAWEAIVHASCRHFGGLTEPERQIVRDRLRILVAEKNWEGCNGLILTDEIKVAIAAHAALMTIGLPELPYGRLESILVYPDTFVATRRTRIDGGGFLESDEPRLGEAWTYGVVILVWREIREQCIEAQTGHNVIVHEFAHILDMEDRDVDGVPSLESAQQYDKWIEVTEAEFHRLDRQARLGRRTLLDVYGATNRAEFFAVASETFFEQPVRLREEIPQLYEVLKGYYRQDPAAREPKGDSAE
jgi:Mlc titration factor MtfA (ptsG expression regulator)